MPVLASPTRPAAAPRPDPAPAAFAMPPAAPAPSAAGPASERPARNALLRRPGGALSLRLAARRRLGWRPGGGLSPAHGAG